MKMIDTLANISRLCIDTMPFIYYIEENPLYVNLVQVFIDRIDRGELEAVSSIITLTEVLTLPIRLQNSKLEQAYRFVLLHSGNFEMISITETIASRAAHLRAQYNLKTPDALQIATAVETGRKAFLTNDLTIKRIQAIKVLIAE